MPDIRRLRAWLLAAALLWMAIVNGSLLWNTRVGILQGYGDFASFYTAGTLVDRGLGAEIYHPAAQWNVQQEFAAGVKVSERYGPLPYIRPPFEALLFASFARLPYADALVVWACFKLILLAVIPFVVVQRGSWNAPFPLWMAGLLVLGTYPEFVDLLMGQDAPLLVLLFAIAFRQLAAHRDAGAGITLGLALFKFHLVIPIVAAILIAGRKRVLSGFAASGAAAVAVSVMIVGWKGLWDYPKYLLALNQVPGSGMIFPENQTNLRGLLSLFVGRVPYPGRIHWILAPVALAAIVYAGLMWRKAEERLLAEGFGLAIIATVVTSYYSYDDDFLLLIVPLLAMWARPAVDVPAVDQLGGYFESAGLLLLLLAPVYWFTRMQLRAECLMIFPLLAVGVAWARRLRLAGAAASPEGIMPLPVGPG